MSKLTKIGQGGRIVIPAECRTAMGVREGDEVLLEVEDGELRIIGRAAARKQAKALVAKHVPPEVSLVDELIAERRREVAGEEPGE